MIRARFLLLAFVATSAPARSEEIAPADVDRQIDRYLAARDRFDLVKMRESAARVVAAGELARAALELATSEAGATLERSLAGWDSVPIEARAVRVAQEVARAHLELVRDESRFPDRDPAPWVRAEVDRRARALLEMASARDSGPFLDADREVVAARRRIEGLAELLVRFPGVREIPGPDVARILAERARPVDREELGRLAPWAAPPSPRANAEPAADPAERDLTEAIDAYRAILGLPRLVIHASLTAAARSHAQEMGELGYFDHRSPTAGRTRPSDRVGLAGYRYSSVGEVLARGDFPPDAILASWWESAAHHRALVDARFREIGLARVGEFWVAVLARPER